MRQRLGDTEHGRFNVIAAESRAAGKSIIDAGKGEVAVFMQQRLKEAVKVRQFVMTSTLSSRRRSSRRSCVCRKRYQSAGAADTADAQQTQQTQQTQPRELLLASRLGATARDESVSQKRWRRIARRPGRLRALLRRTPRRHRRAPRRPRSLGATCPGRRRDARVSPCSSASAVATPTVG
jgi:hypothetical protein